MNIEKIFVIIVITLQVSYANLIDAQAFEAMLSDVINTGVGVSKIQEEYDNLQYSEQIFTKSEGGQLITELANTLAAKFDNRIETVKNLRRKVELSYRQNDPSVFSIECCKQTDISYDKKFKNWVNRNAFCTVATKQTKDRPSVESHINNEVFSDMQKKLKENDNLKWQFYATETGIISVYPATRICDDKYDPRFRPWYVQAVSPRSKDVVIVIDQSQSMRSVYNDKSLLVIAKEAANTVIDSLSPDDRVAVVAFSENVHWNSPDDAEKTCFSKQLARANPQTKEYMKNFVNTLTASGDTNYNVGLKAGFSYFSGSEKKDKVMLFLTDGEPTNGLTDEVILQTVNESNAKLNNSVVILTYGIGNSLTARAKSLLKKIAELTHVDGDASLSSGNFKHIQDPNNLRTEMALFYDLFSRTNSYSNEPLFVVPYFDTFGLGLITSAVLPVRHNDVLQGVVGVDIPMADLLSAATYFKQGELSYAFIIDTHRRTLAHPLLPRPFNLNNDLFYIDIASLEHASGIENVIESMVRMETGNVTLASRRSISRGESDREGVDYTSITSTYYWTRIPRTQFSVCIVLGEGDRQAFLKHLNMDSFTYHRIDLKQPSQLCNNFGRLATRAASVVKLSPDAFEDPFQYLDDVETPDDVNNYEAYMLDSSKHNGIFKPGVRNSIAASSKVDEIWTSAPASVTEYAVWRYMAVEEGFIRMYPGISLPNNYDARIRPWYTKSIANKGKKTVTTPYVDLFGAKYVLSLCSVIYEGRSGFAHTSDDPVAAVMCMDFTLPHFYTLITDLFPSCKDKNYVCFVFDSSGHIIMHKDFIEKWMDRIKIENIHMSVLEPSITKELIEQGAMQKENCIDYERIRNQYYWKVRLTTAIATDNYEIHPVEGSNAYFVIRKENWILRTFAPCTCTDGNTANSALLFKCLKGNPKGCECPCYSAAGYDYCTDKFDTNVDDSPPCTPKAPVLNVTQFSTEKIKNLDLCFDNHCSNRISKQACFGVAGCSWCVKDSSGVSLSRPQCTRQEVCYFGSYNSEIQLPTTQSAIEEDVNTKDGLHAGVIAAIVLGAAAFASVIALILINICRYHRNSQRTSADRLTINSSQADMVYHVNPLMESYLSQQALNQSHPLNHRQTFSMDNENSAHLENIQHYNIPNLLPYTETEGSVPSEANQPLPLVPSRTVEQPAQSVRQLCPQCIESESVQYRANNKSFQRRISEYENEPSVQRHSMEYHPPESYDIEYAASSVNGHIYMQVDL